MKREIAYSTSRRWRVTENNFWFTVERKGSLKWTYEFSTRDRQAALRYLHACEVAWRA